MLRSAYYALERLLRARIAGFPALRVLAVRQLSPHMRRITFAGKSLDAFATDEALHVKLLLPPAGARRDRWLAIDRRGRARIRGDGDQPIYRTYTIRSIDPAKNRIVIDFVMHADGGPGTSWAAQARRGDVVGMTGPRGRGLSPADWYLIAGDESALPVIGRMLELLPDEATGVVIVEVADRRDEQPLKHPRGVELRWLHRDRLSQPSESPLAEAVAAVPWPADGRTSFAWAGAEFSAIQAIRAQLRAAQQLAKGHLLAVPYWRREAMPAE